MPRAAPFDSTTFRLMRLKGSKVRALKSFGHTSQPYKPARLASLELPTSPPHTRPITNPPERPPQLRAHSAANPPDLAQLKAPRAQSQYIAPRAAIEAQPDRSVYSPSLAFSSPSPQNSPTARAQLMMFPHGRQTSSHSLRTRTHDIH